MAFTQAELDNISNAALDFFFEKGKVFPSTLQARPFLADLEKHSKDFSGGAGNISVAVKGVYGAGGSNDALAGYTHNDTVNFYNPANIERVNYEWKEHHIGLTVTYTELKRDGLSVVDSVTGENTRSISGRDKHVLVNLMKDKVEDLGEQYARGLNDLVYGDGTADTDALAGIEHIIAADPTTGSVGGINRATAGNEWWRNRAFTGVGAVTSATANGGALLQKMQTELRQLRRYGGAKNLGIYAGADYINACEVEMRANGYYSQEGFMGKQDGAMGDIYFKGMPIKYDPSLDDKGQAKRSYWVDLDNICLMKMPGEWRRIHNPARPHNSFVLYRSITSTGQMIAKRCNSSMVLDIA